MILLKPGSAYAQLRSTNKDALRTHMKWRDKMIQHVGEMSSMWRHVNDAHSILWVLFLLSLSHTFSQLCQIPCTPVYGVLMILNA